MKVEVIGYHRLHPERRQDVRQTALLPVVDSWYSFRRTFQALYLFVSHREDKADVPGLRRSLSRTLNFFPQLVGTLVPCIQPENGTGLSRRRIMVAWGGDTPGGEIFEAQTNARVQSLHPPSAHEMRSFLWDRAGESLGPLFPQTAPKTTGMRVQVTSFRCGGFSIALDLDHALADGHTVDLFVSYWSNIHAQMFAPRVAAAQSPALPTIVFNPHLVQSKAPQVEKDHGPHTVLLQKASQLPTRRPDFRGPKHQRAAITVQDTENAVPLAKSSAGVPYLLYVRGPDFERITRQVRDGAKLQITDQVAFMSYMWAAVNRARARALRKPQITDLHLSQSFRWTLGLPEGLLGSPLVAVMINDCQESETAYTDHSKLALMITSTLEKYDEDALLAIIYDASLRDVPVSSSRSPEVRERLEFTTGIQQRSGQLSFGLHTLTFSTPIVMPMDYLFLMGEGLPKPAEKPTPGTSSRWYQRGAHVFFSMPRDVVKAMMADPAFADFELLSDEMI